MKRVPNLYTLIYADDEAGSPVVRVQCQCGYTYEIEGVISRKYCPYCGYDHKAAMTLWKSAAGHATNPVRA